MKRISIALVAVAVAMFLSCEKDPVSNGETTGERIDAEIHVNNVDDEEDPVETYYGLDRFLVANRGSSTVTVYDARNTNFITNITLPDLNAEPTYLAHSRDNGFFYVGDYANSKVLYYDKRNYQLAGEIAVGMGAGHMWLNDHVGQLWVNNSVSKTTSVIDIETNTLKATIPLPTSSNIPEITGNAVQNDVVLSPNGMTAYVTIDDTGDKSYVVMYDTTDFKYVRHAEVEGRTHLLPVGGKIYAATQSGNKVIALDGTDLSVIKETPFESPHGITKSNKFFFASALEDNNLGVFDRRTGEAIFELETEFNSPHSIVTNKLGNILFSSHSGISSTQVVFYKVRGDGTLRKLRHYDSGANPHGVLNY